MTWVAPSGVAQLEFDLGLATVRVKGSRMGLAALSATRIPVAHAIPNDTTSTT
jgi:hypothetical protein